MIGTVEVIMTTYADAALYIVNAVGNTALQLKNPPYFAVYLFTFRGSALLWALSSAVILSTLFAQLFATTLIARKAW